MPTNAESIPTGEIAAVAGSPFDFTEPALIGTQMNELASKLGIRAPWDDRTRYAHRRLAAGTLMQPLPVLDAVSARPPSLHTPGLSHFFAAPHSSSCVGGREPAAALPELSSPGGARSSAPLGFDHNYALRRGNVLARLVRRLFRGGMRSVATVNDAASGTRSEFPQGGGIGWGAEEEMRVGAVCWGAVGWGVGSPGVRATA